MSRDNEGWIETYSWCRHPIVTHWLGAYWHVSLCLLRTTNTWHSLTWRLLTCFSLLRTDCGTMAPMFQTITVVVLLKLSRVNCDSVIPFAPYDPCRTLILLLLYRSPIAIESPHEDPAGHRGSMPFNPQMKPLRINDCRMKTVVVDVHCIGFQ